MRLLGLISAHAGVIAAALVAAIAGCAAWAAALGARNAREIRRWKELFK